MLKSFNSDLAEIDSTSIILYYIIPFGSRMTSGVLLVGDIIFFFLCKILSFIKNYLLINVYLKDEHIFKVTISKNMELFFSMILARMASIAK
jgi:hypothetical protein